MATKSLPQYILHPAWEAITKRLKSEERWELRAQGKPGGYYDWEIALVMCVSGYGADLIVTKRDADGQPLAYEFPERWLPVYEEPEEHTPGRKQLRCNRWLIERHLTEGERLVRLLGEYKHRHAQEMGYELACAERSARRVIEKENLRRSCSHRNAMPSDTVARHE